MSNMGSTGSSQTLVLAAIAAVVVSGAVYTSGVFAPSTLPQQNAPVEPVVQVEPDAAIVEPEVVVATPEIDVTPDPVTAAVAYIAPSFDVVRFTPDGSGQVAGSAEPGAIVAILLDGDVLSEVEVGRDGKFFGFVAVEPTLEPRVMSLLQKIDGEEIYSDATVIIALNAPVVAEVTEPAEEVVTEDVQVAMAEPAATATPDQPDVVADADVMAVIDTDSAAEPVADAVQVTSVEVASLTTEAATLVEENTDAAETVARATISETVEDTTAAVVAAVVEPAEEAAQEASVEVAALTEPAQQPAAPQPQASPVVIIADSDGARVLQSPTAPELAPEVLASVAIDSISYSDLGEVQVAGRSPSGDFVRLYLDNTLNSTVRIAKSGLWEAELPDVAPGVYTLRVDQVADGGEVVSRVETPFKREPNEKLVAATQEIIAKRVQAVTVQPGMTLWAISKENYGDGRLYVQVFEANKDRIRNPDLIYPGQVFTVPNQN